MHDVLRSPGQPLDPADRAFLEPRFGHDFTDIRIHSDSSAGRSARKMGAFAYTVGQHVVVDPVRYRPGTADGRRQLAHELAHTIQQSAGNGRPRSLERETQLATETSSASAASSQPIGGDRFESHGGSADGAGVQRQPDDSMGEESVSAGAPPVVDYQVDYEFDPALEEEATLAPAQSMNEVTVQTSIQRLADSFGTVQRQPASTPAASGARPLVAPSLSWSDFALVPNRIGGLSAMTRWTFRAQKGTGITVAFNRAASWSVLADQTVSLLRHEQYHLKLAVLMANRANAAAGTMSARALFNAARTASETHNRSYGGDTVHGTKAALQTLWEQDIDAGVPEFPITPATPGR